MNKIKIIISCLLSLFIIFSVIPLSSQVHAYNYVNSQYLAINPYYINDVVTVNKIPIIMEFKYGNFLYQFYMYGDNYKCTAGMWEYPNLSEANGHYQIGFGGRGSLYFSILNLTTNTWTKLIQLNSSNFSAYANFTLLSVQSTGNLESNGDYYFNVSLSSTNYNNIYDLYLNVPFDPSENGRVVNTATYNVNRVFRSGSVLPYVPDVITAAVILGVQNSGGSGSGSVDTTNIINAIIQARESIIDTVEDGDDYIQSMLIFMAEILYGDLSGNDNDPTVEEILDSGAINILDYYFKDYFNQLYNRYKNENNQIVNAIWQALNTGNAVNASDNVAAINALKSAISDEIANSGQLSYIEYISYIVDYLDVFYMSLYNQNVEILQKVDRLLTISSSNTATITNRIQQSENNIIDGINDAGENTGSPDLSHTGLDSALSQGSGWAAQILHASSIIDQATQDVGNFLVSGSSVLNSILTAFPIFGVILSFVLVFFLVRKVIGR